MNKYAVIIYWSEEDGVFVAEAPSLPGCAAHGDTHEEALGNIQDAIGLWVDTAQEFERSVPEPQGRSSIFRLNGAIARELSNLDDGQLSGLFSDYVPRSR